MNLEPLLSLIQAHEAPKGFNQVYGGIKQKDLPPRPITQMTVDQVLAWQDSIDRFYPSEAAGGFQIMEDTLRDMKDHGIVPGSALFDAATQKALAKHLMRKRGLGDYAAGIISAEKFCNELAKEWASLPVVVPVQRVTRSKAGKITKKWTVPVGASYYAGDGLNKAHVTPEAVLAAVKAIQAPTPATRPNIAPTPQISARGGSIIGKAIAALAFFAALAVAAVSKWFCALPFLSFICGD